MATREEPMPNETESRLKKSTSRRQEAIKTLPFNVTFCKKALSPQLRSLIDVTRLGGISTSWSSNMRNVACLPQVKRTPVNVAYEVALKLPI
jgi:hypothetical protein